MEKQLEIATARLYKVFAKYPFKSTIEGCPCCVSDSDKATLHSKPLRSLEDEDISRYAFKAMTTWGDIDDFKHYLPRIFELSSKRELIVDAFVVLGKLKYGNWREWKEDEQQAISNFLKAWWKDAINNSYFDTQLLIEINKLLCDLPLLLQDWNLELETKGFKNYVDLVEYNYQDLRHKNRTFKTFKPQEVSIIITWIEKNMNKLEEGFFKYDDEGEEEFSQRLSNIIYTLDRID